MEIITGYTGRSHITPSLDASINSAIFGNNNVVLNFGDKLSFSSPTIGKIVIGSGALCFSGRIAVSENSEEKNYTPPATGEYSHCKIVARYKRAVNDGTNQESISIVLLQSIDSATSETSAFNLPVEEYEEKVINQSTTAADFVLYDFVVSNYEIVTTNVEPKFQVVDSIVSLKGDVDYITESVQTNKNAISSNETRIEANETSINTNNTIIADHSSMIKDLQDYRISMLHEFTSYEYEYTFDELDKKSLILFVVDNSISFICDFSKFSFPTSYIGQSGTMYNGDYTLTFYTLRQEGFHKLRIYKLLKRNFETKDYEVYSASLNKKTTIHALTSKEEEINFGKVRIYRILPI